MRQGWARVVTLPGVLVGLVVLWWLWPSTPRLYLVHVAGPATVTRAGVDDALEAREGTRLQVSDHLVTDRGGEAVLQFGTGTEILVGPASSVEVASVDEAGLSLELEDGSVRAIVRPDSGEVRIGNRGRAAVTSGATFDMGVRDAVVQVRAVEGTVTLEGVDADRLEAGEEAVLVHDRARVGRVPSSLLLSVAAPEAARTSKTRHVVRGRTAPAAEVVLVGPATTSRGRADADGRFAVPVPLVEGENAVTVKVEDVFGQSRSTQAVLPVLDTTGPVVSGDVEYPE